MNGDYLWDKSGEPDPEIVRLENSVGRFRYKAPASPLPLPVVSRPWFRLRFSPMMAAAAGIVVLLLAGGVWLSFRRSVDSQKLRIVSGAVPRTGPTATTAQNKATDAPRHPAEQPITFEQPRIRNRVQHLRQQQVTRETQTRSARLRREQQLARRGELAKEQLIKALLITSDKLNAVQKKIQDSQEREPIS